MKKVNIILITIVLIMASCSSSRLSKSGNAEKEFVSGFLKEMMNHGGYVLMRYIAPSYIAENKLDTSKFSVNSYSPVDFSIESYNSGVVTVKIWGRSKSWIHRLKFKVVKEKGKLYLYPMKHTDSYIHPWFSVESYIED